MATGMTTIAGLVGVGWQHASNAGALKVGRCRPARSTWAAPACGRIRS